MTEGKTLDVVLVEDNALNRELFQDLLEGENHAVRAAYNGAELRAHVRAGEVPDVVLMDILLPDSDGVELLKELRYGAWSHVPVAALTAQATAGDAERFLAAGFDAVIVKPIDTRTFVKRVELIASAAVSRPGPVPAGTMHLTKAAGSSDPKQDRPAPHGPLLRGPWQDRAPERLFNGHAFGETDGAFLLARWLG